MGPMLQTILEERFKLTVRRGKRDVEGYVLTVGKAGPKLHAAPAGSCIEPGQSPAAKPPDRLGCGMQGPDGANGFHTITSMDSFAATLSFKLGRPVVNTTNLSGLFDIRIPNDPTIGPSDPPGSSLFGALQDLGLKLESAKVPLDFIIVDHIERPTENDVVEQTPRPPVPSTATTAITQSSRLSFAAASIHPATARNYSSGFCHGIDMPNIPDVPLGRCIFQNATALQIIETAFKAVGSNKAVEKAPSWASADHFEMQAVAEDPAHTTDVQLLQMLQDLLVDRFKLRLHFETRQSPGYELQVVKAGVKFSGSAGTDRPTMQSPGPGRVIGYNQAIAGIARVISARWVVRSSMLQA